MYIAHALPGRLRVRTKVLIKNHHLKSYLGQITLIEGIIAIKINIKTGSILIQYNRHLTQNDVLQIITGFINNEKVYQEVSSTYLYEKSPVANFTGLTELKAVAEALDTSLEMGLSQSFTPRGTVANSGCSTGT